ncbi:zf-HC2 domain-containing protein [Aneurinibacillus sp. Ricciae_BoGa-3]|uniref:anti-sigma factor family protein n=1 Tax=Aneurinibacillus sp. Ricciae_BoGa-3 TaxID=3022697 RepID=UPI0023401F49|nr:zf-HC2 domain-containing protein [Aneurinibacillus sp. Ricciae_BoGa-3]WCK52930.1 zf-HC2 domain-containing protein [Aneurinibacillus sp. Ricciae_BoGa-3]
MSDVHVVDQLSDFLDKELPKEEEQRVSEHLHRCQSCRALFEDLKLVSTIIHEDFLTYTASDNLTDRIFAGIEESQSLLSRKRWVIGTALTILMSGLLIFIGLLSGWGLFEGKILYLFMHVAYRALSVLTLLVGENTILLGELLLISSAIMIFGVWSLKKLLRNFAMNG